MPIMPAKGGWNLELVTDADCGIHVGGVKVVTAGQAVVHAAVHDARVSIEVMIEEVVRVEGECLETSAASAVRSGRAAGYLARGVGILLDAIVRSRKVEIRYDGVAHADPVHL